MSHPMQPTMRSKEDVGAVFMRKCAEKRKILEEAQAVYHKLSANVEKANIELSGIKLEHFRLEGSLQEAEIRIKMFEKMETELRDQAERARVSIQEAEAEQNEYQRARDIHNKGFVKKVMEMAEDYCSLKRSCDKNTIANSFRDLTETNGKLNDQIQELMFEMGLKDEENPVAFISSDLENESTMQELRQLQKHLEHDIHCSEIRNANLKAQTSQLEILRTTLQKEVEALKEIIRE